MARIEIPLPEAFVFETLLDIRIGDINYGGHLANDALLRLAHEARLRFFKTHGYSELDVEGHGIIMTDAAIVYKAEVFHGETLHFQLGFADPNKYGFDLIYQASHGKTGHEVARLKTGIVFFDYDKRKIAPMPGVFVTRFLREQQGVVAS
ncbi:thioesterase family protein [Pseudogulbenkiania sp. MAI-1]|uniref:thioesterase family protein n=1 Tax=Pseudogulbenkiania sp. MAI-1 TaxID=990370 RepID=UPI00045E5966|nr:thioesterase family protein [Pseudogulbenkiania sp. MAI-1]